MAKIKYGSMAAREDEKKGEDKAMEAKAETAGKEAEGAKMAAAAAAPAAPGPEDMRSKHAKARAELRKMHEAERRDLNNSHRDERRKMYERQDKAIEAMMDAHDLEVTGAGAQAPADQTTVTAAADAAE